MRVAVASLMFVAAATLCRAQDIYDLPWRVSDARELEVQLYGDSNGARQLRFGDWEPMFPGLFAQAAPENRDLDWLTDWGPMVAIPLLVHGDGGAAAIHEATRRLRKLDVPTTIDWVALGVLQRDPWLDLLHVQHLATFDVYVATWALREFADDEKADPFVRAAAADAHSRCSGHSDKERAELVAMRVRRNGAAALHAGLMLLPDDVDLVIGVHGAAMPPAGPLLTAWRHVGTQWTSAAMVAAGGAISPAQMSTGQLLIDRPGQLPFELALRLGNWRVDHALLAVRAGEHQQWWFHAGGLFQPERIAEGLRASNFAVNTSTPSEVHAVVHGFVMRATATELEVWSEGLQPGRRGSHVPTLRDRADADQAPVWAFVPATSRLATNAGAGGTSLDVRFDPAKATATASATCPDEATATKLLAAWRTWQGERRCDRDTKVGAREDNPTTWGDVAERQPGCCEPEVTRLVWRRGVQAVRAEQQGATVRWSLDLAPFTLVQLARLLGCSPRSLLTDG